METVVEWNGDSSGMEWRPVEWSGDSIGMEWRQTVEWNGDQWNGMATVVEWNGDKVIYLLRFLCHQKHKVEVVHTQCHVK